MNEGFFFSVFLLSYVNFEDKVRNLHNKGQAYFVGSLCRKFSKLQNEL